MKLIDAIAAAASSPNSSIAREEWEGEIMLSQQDLSAEDWELFEDEDEDEFEDE